MNIPYIQAEEKMRGLNNKLLNSSNMYEMIFELTGDVEKAEEAKAAMENANIKNGKMGNSSINIDTLGFAGLFEGVGKQE